jgi:hypothetical protein
LVGFPRAADKEWAYAFYGCYSKVANSQRNTTRTTDRMVGDLGTTIEPIRTVLAIVYGTSPNTLEIFDIARLRPIARRDWSGSPGCSIAWSRNEKTLVVNGDGNFRVYGVPKLTVLRELPVEYPCFVQFSHSEEFLALGSWKKSFIIPTDFLDEFEKSKKRIHPSSRRAAH